MTVKVLFCGLLRSLPLRTGLCDDCPTEIVGPRHCQQIPEALAELR